MKSHCHPNPISSAPTLPRRPTFSAALTSRSLGRPQPRLPSLAHHDPHRVPCPACLVPATCVERSPPQEPQLLQGEVLCHRGSREWFGSSELAPSPPPGCCLATWVLSMSSCERNTDELVVPCRVYASVCVPCCSPSGLSPEELSLELSGTCPDWRGRRMVRSLASLASGPPLFRRHTPPCCVLTRRQEAAP